MTTDQDERLRRWRLLLGGDAADDIGCSLGTEDIRIDSTLSALYDSDRHGSLASSAPNVPRWLGDVRRYFPKSVVQVMQRDAFERLDMNRMLLEPELLEAIEADVHFVATLLSLRGVMPAKTRDTARQVVAKVVEELTAKLENPMRQAVVGALDRATRNTRPRHAEIDWDRTIRANLKTYQPDLGTIIPERLIGYGRRRSSLRHVILCVDQSGSMAASVVYAGIFGAVMASLPALATRLVVFDTAVVDLSEDLDDPVDLLFGTQLGGGTDIARALGYCQGVVEQPAETILVLISDLFEGGDRAQMLQRAGALIASGVQFITLLALNDDGAPGYDHAIAAELAAMGAPAFACTPDQFPDLMAAAINCQDIGQWAASRDIVTSRAAG